MRTGYPQAEENNLAIAGYLAVCGLICGLAVFGFYKLIQPTQNANPGLAAYKPPPGTVITYPLVARSREQPVLSSPTTELVLRDIHDETTGRVVPTVEPTPAVAPSPATQVKAVPSPSTQVKKELAAKAVAARSDSTRRTPSTQSHPSHTFIGPYPGYATVN